MALTAKQQRFVEEYLIDLNATQAAIRAGYSAANADKIGPELLGKTRVAEAIQAAIALRSERTNITQDDVLKGLLSEAKLTGKGASHAARVSAWVALGKHLGMFSERFQHEHSGRDGGPIEHEHTVTARIEQLAASFAAAARREAGAVPGNGARKPVDS